MRPAISSLGLAAQSWARGRPRPESQSTSEDGDSPSDPTGSALAAGERAPVATVRSRTNCRVAGPRSATTAVPPESAGRAPGSRPAGRNESHVSHEPARGRSGRERRRLRPRPCAPPPPPRRSGARGSPRRRRSRRTRTGRASPPRLRGPLARLPEAASRCRLPSGSPRPSSRRRSRKRASSSKSRRRPSVSTPAHPFSCSRSSFVPPPIEVSV